MTLLKIGLFNYKMPGKMVSGLIIAFLFPLAGPAQPTALFKMIPAKQTGVRFENKIKETEISNVLAYEYFYNGGGVAVGDINNDGLLDIYFTGNMSPDRLYLNTGNLIFRDLTKKAHICDRAQWKTGVSMADVNADGYLDIYVCYSGSGDEDERRNQLFINNGDLTFTERSKEFGLDDPGYGTQATFFDYDRDGDLDMYLLNHNIEDYKEVDLPHLKTTYDPLAADKLFRNDDGTFIDVSQTAGISGNPISYGLGVSLGDINNDGWLDIYVSNDYQENDYLYINNQDGTFTDRSATSFRHISNFSMGNDIADFNNDGLLDIITLDMLPESNERQKLLKDPDNYELYKASVANGFNAQFMRNMLQLNNGDGTFSEIGQLAGVSNTDWSWAPLFADFDNDGYKDLFVSNGYLRDYTNRDFLKYWGNYLIQKAVKMEESYLMELVEAMPSTLLKNYVFQNNRDLTFSNKTSDWGLDQDLLSNGAVYADLDNDGDLDLITNNVNEQASIFQNQSSEVQGNHFLDFELKGPQNNPNGIGARVAIYQSGKVQIHEQISVRGFQSAVSPVVHFGLGKSENVDSAIVRWPTGEVTRHFALAANQRIKLDLLQLEPQDLSNPPDQDQYFELVKGLPIQYQHKDLHFNDFKRQPTIPFSYSQTGPQMAQADVNGDGLMDMFIGGDQGEPGHYYQQQPDGSFKELNSPIFRGDRDYSDVEAVFFDANCDGALDLYVTGGMYHDFQPHDPMLGDRLYINDGSGNFITRVELPTSANGKSCVRPYDFDQDGDMDLFLGGRVVPGRYPEIPKSYFLMNDGTGHFTDQIAEISPELEYLGMITDAQWTDIDGDGIKDLIIVGEWMDVNFFINHGAKLINKTSEYFEQHNKGFWNEIVLDDLDNDGDQDLIVGNMGTNTQMKASAVQPIEIVFNDFDSNGSVDPFLCYYVQGTSYPDMSRDLLLDQIYPMRKKFTSYKSYANTTLKEILTDDQLAMAKSHAVTTLETTLFENVNGRYVARELPAEIQFSPIRSLRLMDINDDGFKDLLAFGNDNNPRLKFGKFDANYGMLFLNRGGLTFEYTPQTKSGFCITGDVCDVEMINYQEQKLLVLGVVGQPLITYKLKSHEK